MKYLLWFIGIACVLASACRSVKSGAATTAVPQGYYRVMGEVKHPGLQPCAGPDKTLQTLISASGGFTDFAITKKICVIQSGVTNTYDYQAIATRAAADPPVPCGSLVWVPRMFDSF